MQVIIRRTQVQGKKALESNAAVVQTVKAILPEGQVGVMDSFSDMSMPVLEIGGVDYAALVEIPELGVTLPVADRWGHGWVAAGPGD